ncbi:MAG: hypothetical protein DRI33_00855 [Caldiserica bacterium]|nr:MAG: hypothetical protein DRI33_00855 [Caldisericota bacterium]
MEDLNKKINEMENQYQKIIEKIPGFAGYFAREKRRTADKLLRQYLADRLRKTKDELLSKGNTLLKKKEFDALEELNELIKNFQFVVDKIEYAPQGYSGFFGSIKADTKMLDRLYAVDASLLSLIEKSEKIVADETKTVKEIISNMKNNLRDFKTFLNERLEILSGIK